MDLDTDKFIEELKGATILELNDLVKAIEDEFDVTAAAPVAAAGAADAGAAKSEFDVELTEAGQEKVKVIKNTYLRRAAAKAGIEGLDDTFVGPTAVIYTDNADDVTEPARIVSKYEDDFDVIEIKGGMLEGKLTSKEEIKELAAIPGREGLLSMLVSVLQAPVRDFAYAVKAVAESKDEDSAE